MNIILAGLVAALFSYLGNKLALKSFGKAVVIAFVPLIEEVAKTMTAVFIGAPIILTHGVFGLVEAAYDYRSQSSPSIGPSLLSFLGHVSFGIVTYLFYLATGVLGYGLIAGILSHTFWNLGMVDLIMGLGGKRSK